ncbi:unnamed protein product, partial [Pleuronectes platessa]
MTHFAVTVTADSSADLDHLCYITRRLHDDADLCCGFTGQRRAERQVCGTTLVLI